MPTQRETRPGPRRASRLPYALAVVMLGLFVVAAWVARGRFQPVIAGQPAPDYQVVNMQGEPVRLSDYRGSVVLLNVWATWCPPCLEEMPSMERLYTEVRSWPGGEDFEILAVSIDASRERPDLLGRGVGTTELQAFAEELGLTFPIVHDAPGEIQRVYQTTGVPESFLIGRDGVIHLKYAGPTEWDTPHYLDQIRRLLER